MSASNNARAGFKETSGSREAGHSQAKSQQRARLKGIADSTLRAIDTGCVSFEGGTPLDLAAKIRFSNHNTCYYPPDASSLSSWASGTSSSKSANHAVSVEISIIEASTLEGARLLHDSLSSHSTAHGRIALLNFASATKPGGGFLNGAQAQEESIARSSTLYPSLMTDGAQQFYKLHHNDRKGGFYYHAMIYSPGIVILRDDAGDWVSPFEVDVLTSAAVNAGDVRNKNARSTNPVDPQRLENQIEAAMRERMARILCLFEQQGAKNLVLGSFGTGVFRNDVEFVAKAWAKLLTGSQARFAGSFDRIVFAILGNSTYRTFKRVFENGTGMGTD
ncbi:hypothetical protein BKA82DRAFT_995668 [Pisolithus tinctorius]|uniref:Microbial-type PARG catalytic domain-containing protein n=1 Tax=Pisolithus tinctorius Marx 270 TaxID=870435 RepID=A0A0C3PA57_PISTI|nr:hypothetical protein BKA82DRAFT_995668 [Pisolithus tinctorius]KIO10475.1 hypothetical protein M404DRAFT_995668 [Pisolithus tinctorius Marx 270]